MHPILFEVLGRAVPSWGVLVSLAILVPGLLGHRLCRRAGLPPTTGFDVVLLILLGHLLGGRLAFALARGSLDLGALLSASDAGTNFFGGLAGSAGLIALYLRAKGIPWLLVADIAAPLVALGQGIGRVGCLLAGCCYGRPTDLPWGMTFAAQGSAAPLGVALHPTQPLEMALDLALFGALMTLRGRLPRGGLACAWLISYGLIRFGVQSLRAGSGGGLTGAHLAALGLLALGLLGSWALRRTSDP